MVDNYETYNSFESNVFKPYLSILPHVTKIGTIKKERKVFIRHITIFIHSGTDRNNNIRSPSIPIYRRYK